MLLCILRLHYLLQTLRIYVVSIVRSNEQLFLVLISAVHSILILTELLQAHLIEQIEDATADKEIDIRHKDESYVL